MAQLIPGRPGIGQAFGTGLSNTLQGLADAKLKRLIEQPQREAYASALMSILAPEQAQQQQPNLAETLGAQETQQGTQAQQPLSQQANLARALQQGGLNEQQLFQLASLAQNKQLKQQKQAKEERLEKRDIQKEINASTQKYYDSVIASGKAAKNNLKRANRLEELSLKGSLPPAEVYKYVSKIEEGAPNPIYGAGAGAYAGANIGKLFGPQGAGIGAAIGGAAGLFIGPIASGIKSAMARHYTDQEEFEKLSADFIRDAKGIFGGRITDADLNAFFQTVPTLNQTQQGRLKIIKNMKAFNDAAVAESEALEEVIKENGGERPANLPFLVQKRAQQKIDKAAEEFSA